MFAGVDHLGLFIVAGLLLNLTPGPDVLYVVGSGLRGGWRAGMVAAVAIGAGCSVHVLAATVGLSALIAASATAFLALKWLGAAYLVYVGIGMLLARRMPAPQPDGSVAQVPGAAQTPPADAPGASASAHAQPQSQSQSQSQTQTQTQTQSRPQAEPQRADLRKVFRQGFWTNALNPKVALFFLAFLPQFVHPQAPHKTLTFLVLGLLFTLNSLPVNLAYGLGAAWMAARLGTVQRGMRWLERGAGALFIGFGLRLALSERPN